MPIEGILLYARKEARSASPGTRIIYMAARHFLAAMIHVNIAMPPLFLSLPGRIMGDQRHRDWLPEKKRCEENAACIFSFFRRRAVTSYR